MVTPRKLRTRKSHAQKQRKPFDPNVFLAQVGPGRIVHHSRPKQAIFSQGDPADAVFYVQAGNVRLSVLSKQGKEATLALLGTGDFLVRDASPRINPSDWPALRQLLSPLS